jgi:hypothetical protein
VAGFPKSPHPAAPREGTEAEGARRFLRFDIFFRHFSGPNRIIHDQS